jgi:TPR repeat protein
MAKQRPFGLALSVFLAGSSACAARPQEPVAPETVDAASSARLEPAKTATEGSATVAAPSNSPDAPEGVCSKTNIASCVSQCEEKQGAACQVLAEHAFFAQKNTEARVFAEKACDYGTISGCLLRGTSAAQDGSNEEALVWYSKGCSLGDAKGCEGSAGLAWKALKDPNRAFPLAKRACDLDASVCDLVAEMHLVGEGTPKDGAKAVAIFAASCKSGQIKSCIRAGEELDEGKNVKRDFAAAEKILSFACEKFEAPLEEFTKSHRRGGCFKLAELYERKKDAANATLRFTQACELGAPVACKKIGNAGSSAAKSPSAMR